MQNKICSLNIILNGRIVSSVPVLFRIYESGERTVTDILSSHMQEIVKMIYDNATSLDDIVNSSVNGIVYDINSDDDKYETYELNVGNMLSYDDDKSRELIEKKINEYAKFVADKISPDNNVENFVDIYEMVNLHNDSKISTTTFIQYILSCFNKEYKNDNMKFIGHQIENIMNSKLNN